MGDRSEILSVIYYYITELPIRKEIGLKLNQKDVSHIIKDNVWGDHKITVLINHGLNVLSHLLLIKQSSQDYRKISHFYSLNLRSDISLILK